ncbi:MAG: 50S ribosomal protein L3 N(5)-glutamine methyltransferase [Burkholderiales bacterium]|nr:50S ribosomal protein L3 N(5)-glutamine methyltransferase [Burkholderiales bacterium]
MFTEAKAQLQTIRDLLRFAVSRFNEAGLAFGHGSSNAYDEAAYLILHALHLPLDTLDPLLDARLLPEEISHVLRLLGRRINERIPAAYLTHEAWLGEHKFYVDERVIVPRSFIAELLRDRFAEVAMDLDTIHSGLDLCTGSGCLAVLLALEFPDARITAADISKDALEVARRNVRDYGLDERVEIVESNLFTALPGCRFDLIVSNPPYVTAAAMAALPQEYHYEPPLALGGGYDGLDIVRRIIAGAREHLTEAGALIVEVGHNRDGVERAFPALPFTWLTTSGGDDGVFALTTEQLTARGEPRL